MRSILGMPFAALEEELIAAGLRPAHAKTLWRAIHRESALELDRRDDFLPPIRRWLAGSARGAADLPVSVGRFESTDGLTTKHLLRLADGQTVETVVMAFRGRFTACISTQAGCAMGCVFCATGQMGFSRHLEPEEIVGQVHHAKRAIRAAGRSGPRNLVLMGMGEPLHNYDAVMAALEIITDTRGLSIGPSRITISTVGVVPGILRLAETGAPYNLAVSLHGATEAERAALVPISRRWPLAELIAACRTYCKRTRKRIFFEWTLIAGTNDSSAHASRLAHLLEGLDAHINIIPLNPTSGFSGTAADAASADAFQRILRKAGFPSTIRQRRGIDVAAGCGQLRAIRQFHAT